MMGQYGKVTKVSENCESCTIDFTDHGESKHMPKGPGEKVIRQENFRLHVRAGFGVIFGAHQN